MILQQTHWEPAALIALTSTLGKHNTDCNCDSFPLAAAVAVSWYKQSPICNNHLFLACQGTATPTACWGSCWDRAHGRPRRRRRGSSALESGGRSWRNVPALRKCYLPGVSRWLRSNRRHSTQCGMSTFYCELNALTFFRVADMLICVKWGIHSFICFTLTPKAVCYMTGAAHCHLCGKSSKRLRRLLCFLVEMTNLIWLSCFIPSEIDDVQNDLLHLDIW